MDKQARAKRVGSLLKDRRLALALSIRQAAALIDIPPSTLQYIEKGENRRYQPQLPDPTNALRIAKAYDLDPAKLFELCGYGFEPPLSETERLLLRNYRQLAEQDQNEFSQRLERKVSEAKPNYGSP